MILCEAQSVIRLPAAEAPPNAQNTSATTSPNDYLQFSWKLDQYTELADSGPLRGTNIYWHKCLLCHNKYQKSAPHLEDVFKLDSFIDGSPANDRTVTVQIKDGAPGMPFFRITLSESDVADVVSRLHDSKCSVEEFLPSNPCYRASDRKWTVPNGLLGGPKGLVRIASGDRQAASRCSCSRQTV